MRAMPKQTDANDADGLAYLAEVGFFREVRVKGFDSMQARTRVAARTRLVRISVELSNQIRGVMKTFGLVVPAGEAATTNWSDSDHSTNQPPRTFQRRPISEAQLL